MDSGKGVPQVFLALPILTIILIMASLVQRIVLSFNHYLWHGDHNRFVISEIILASHFFRD